VYIFSCESITELQSVTCRMISSSVTCHLTQVNASCFDPTQTGQYSTYLPQWDGRLSWPWCWLYIKIADCRQSAIQLVI